MADNITEKQQEVIDYIFKKIKDDELLPGDKLDTEIAIAKALKLTRATVREATRILIEQERIYRIKGSGLYIGSIGKSNHSGKFHALSPFDYQAQKSGHKGIRKVISASIIKVPDAAMAQALRIKNSDSVYKILRLMCFDDIPVSLEYIHFPATLFSSMEFKELEISKYSYIERITGKGVQRRAQNVRAFNATDEEMIRLLNIQPHDAMMELYEVVYLDDGTPFEVNISIVNTNILHLKQISERSE
ncbi:TPA: GntR family transcriptional regulator [Raoultella ornithinolytica]|nr:MULTISPECIES: GntR family transcriptional regulator [Klebsiella/Raoultella group]KFD02073.1 succinyl CoA synthetase operon transcriptional regulator [Raoultella planticola ATCC 33531]SXF64267.1 transcriptional regulator, GntR family [Klebsiella variicola]HDG9810401.1 GntR family transcriptional regulator [Raoultella planticola]